MILSLTFSGDIPIYVQLRNQLVLGIGAGDLRPGERLPTVRQLAQDLGVNAMTVNKAYAILKQEGFIEIDRRHGAKVASAVPLTADYTARLEQELALVISEAALRGMRPPEFKQMCDRLFAGQSFAQGQGAN